MSKEVVVLPKEVAEELAREKNEEYRKWLDRQIAEEEMSERDAGPVAATVVDRRTGEHYNGHNNRRRQPPAEMHPIIERRVEAAKADPQHHSAAGSHAEVYALNDALKAREECNKAHGLPPVTEADLDEFTQLPVWRRGSGGSNMAPGEDAPRCGNCQAITDGVHNVTGDAPPMPP